MKIYELTINDTSGDCGIHYFAERPQELRPASGVVAYEGKGAAVHSRRLVTSTKVERVEVLGRVSVHISLANVVSWLLEAREIKVPEQDEGSEGG